MPIEVKGLQSFVRHAAHVATTASRFDETVVRSLAQQSKELVVGAASPKGLSRFGNGKGVTLGARYVVQGGKEPTALLFPTPPGPWHLLEHGGAAHEIGSKVAGRGGKRGQRGQRGFLGSTGLGFAAVGPVQHPAFAPRHTWSRSVEVAVGGAHATFASATRHAYAKLFAG